MLNVFVFFDSTTEGGMLNDFCILTLLLLMSIYFYGMKILGFNTSMQKSKF